MTIPDARIAELRLKAQQASELGDMATAADNLRLALPHLRESGPAAELLTVLANLGDLYYQSGNLEDSLNALDEAKGRLPDELRDSPLEARFRASRGLTLLASGRLEEAKSELTRAKAVYLLLGEFTAAAEQASVLSDVHRDHADLKGAVRHYRDVVQLRRNASSPVCLGSDRPASELAHLPSKVKVGTGRQSQRGRQSGPGPMLLFAPYMMDLGGPLFPRGATSVASFLGAHGVPALVVPLTPCNETIANGEAEHARRRALVADALSAVRPAAVGLTVPFTYVYEDCLDIARMVRAVNPDVPIIGGGPHVTYLDRECLAEAPEIDIVVRSEGEWTALELMRALHTSGDLAKVDGITWRDDEGVIHRNRERAPGNILELPEVDFRLLPDEFCRRMLCHGITSRGCAFRCAFCAEFRFWGYSVRLHSTESVVGEMDRLHRDYGNRMDGIDDSMLDMNSPAFFELCDALQDRESRSDTFGILARIDGVTEEGLRAAKRAGIASMMVGIESGSEQVLAAMNKKTSLHRIKGGLEQARKAGLGVGAFFVVGHPGDNESESEKSIALAEGLFSSGLIGGLEPAMFVPYPGTPFFRRPEQFGVQILTKDWSQWNRNSRPVAQLNDYSADEIYLTYLRLLEVQVRYLS